MQARLFATFLVAGVFYSTTAAAHIEITSGPAAANASNEVTFNVEHGCAGADTNKVVIDIPTGITSVRPLRSDFAYPTISKDMTGTITGVTWQKSTGDALDSDLAFYKLTLRFKTPNQPFTTVYFTAHQTCRASDGTLSTVDWVGLPGAPSSVEPAPALLVVPARVPGWNKYTVPVAMTDLSVYFKDAQIVWKGTAAYSINANTVAQIASTQGVTALTALNAGDEIWVKY